MNIDHLEALLAQGQDNALLRYSLGNAYLQTQAFTQAIIHFAQAIEWDVNYSAAWKGYGKALVGAGETDKAITAYTQGIAIAEKKGDRQAVKEMQVFLRRLQKNTPAANPDA